MKGNDARLTGQRRIITIVLAVAAIVLLAVSFFINEKELQNLIRISGIGLVLAIILFRLFRKKFGYKPTREEIEERVFGKDK